MSGGIVRAARRSGGWTAVPNATVRDVRLSYRARGILARLLTNSDRFSMTAIDLAREGLEGRGAVLRALQELRRAGYVKTVVERVRGGRFKTTTYVFDEPQNDSTGVQKPDSGGPDSGAPDCISNTKKKEQKKTEDIASTASAVDRGGCVSGSGCVSGQGDKPFTGDADTPRDTPPAPPPPAKKPSDDPFAAFQMYADAVGAERYRVTVIKMFEDGDKRAFILDKKDGLTQGFTPQEIGRRMPEMLRLERRGENIYYTPLSDKKRRPQI